MQKIHLLDDDTINKIAAGEVVERPMSAVKELVENAVDAQAAAITVEIRGGGIDMIRVTDSGSGIAREDIRNAFAAHATSKIHTADDLLSIGTLGFRGEALSSIAAVSQVELITKTHGDLTGIRYVIEGGAEKSMQEIGCPDGTTIIVRNLFYNTPARRRFLKSAATEGSYVAELVSRLALSHPEVAFKFINNSKTRLHTSGNSQLRDIVYQVYGREITGQLMSVSLQTDLLQIEGYIGKPILSRGNRAWENYFINGRYIKSNIITKAIEDAYKTFVMVHRFPFTAFNISIDPAAVDVNVHPRKMEVRFNSSEAVYQQVYGLIRGTLEHRELIPSVSIEKRKEQNKVQENVPEPFEIQRLARMGTQGQQTGRTGNYERPQTLAGAAGERGAAYRRPQAAAGGHETAYARPQSTPGGREASYERLKTTPGGRETAYQRPQAPAGGHEAAYQQPQAPAGGHEAAYQQPQAPAGGRETAPAQPQTPSRQQEGRSPEKTDFSSSGGQEKPIRGQQMQFSDDRLLSQKARAKHRLIGQVFGTYWLIEYNEKLYIIDQHAAHEKVLYERLIREYRSRSVQKQMLSPPVIVTLSPAEQVIYEKYKDYFEQLSFENEPFGGNEFAISAVPLQLFGMSPRDMFIEVLDSLTEESGSIEGSAITYKIATMACKAAVKGNTLLPAREADALIDELLQTENPYSCPHGRPTIISFTRYELDKKFGRIQN